MFARSGLLHDIPDLLPLLHRLIDAKVAARKGLSHKMKSSSQPAINHIELREVVIR
jgi:hypothetical protein